MGQREGDQEEGDTGSETVGHSSVSRLGEDMQKHREILLQEHRTSV